MDSHVIRTKNFAADAAHFILARARNALGERNEFRIALSGGNTPIPIYTRLAAIGRDLPWDLTRITFGDERAYPRMIDRATLEWLGKLFSRPPQFLRNQSCVCAAKSTHKLDRLAAQRGEPIYRHDLILLGLGDDGTRRRFFLELLR